MNRYSFKFSALFILFFLGFVSCKTAQVNELEVLNRKLENALLWKVEGKELKEPSYVFGTIHIIPDEDYFLPDGTLTALDQSDQIYFEIDMKDMTDISKQMGMLSNAFMKDGVGLKDLLSEEEYKIVDAHFKEMGMPLFLFEKMKPMFLTVFASSDFDPNGIQTGALKSYEMELYDIAERSNKGTGGLETIEYQLSLFDSIPYPDQAQMLVETIKNSDTAGDQFRETIDMYVSQNIENMADLSESGDGELNDYEDILLIKRNKNWIPIMEEQMKKGSSFFAVGAGHLGGKNGVIKLLMLQGYRLTPIKSN